MTIEQIRHAYSARPFQPFIIHLADGRQISVPHPEFMALSPSGRAVAVSQPDGAFEIVDLLLAATLEFAAPQVS
jgi:hypothetical protein